MRQGVTHFARQADGRAGIGAGQLEQTFEHALPAFALVGVTPDLDLLRLIEARLGPGDIESQLQAAQFVDQSGLLGVDAAEDATAGGSVACARR